MAGDTDAFGSQLVTHRRLAGLSQEKLAGRSGLTSRTIGNLERGRTESPHPDSACRLADALDLKGEVRRLFIAASVQRSLPAAPAAAAPAPTAQLTQAPVDPGGSAQVVPHHLPPAVGYFIGREKELAWLTGLLSMADRPVGVAPISVISGAAGIGKTALAVRWAHQIADRFPDGQLYVNLMGFARSGRPAPKKSAIRKILAALHVPAERIPADRDVQTGLYRSLMWGKRILVVLDNAQNSAQVRPLLPSASGCMVVVTSRSWLSGLVTAEGAVPLRLSTFTDAEARDLLTWRLGAARLAAEPQATAEILGLCEGAPLALAVAAARAATQPGLQLAMLAERLKKAQASRAETYTARGK